jgi:hypothetical protein|nr:MAG TPA: hypothetical protein [Caudoviricetes sp.]
MEDKRKEEIKNKIDKIDDLNEKIDFYKKKLENTMGMLEFLDTFECCIISLTGCSDDEGYRECVPMPLRGNNMEEVVAMIEKKLENQVADYDDEIAEAYQELDELLK